MPAYHNDPAVKAAILAQLEAHAAADEITQGVAWEYGKGCAVGCTLHAYDHALYESRFGIPQMLARLEDAIFEGLPAAQAKEWPLRFMRAIEPGADLSRVGWRFLHWLLTDPAVSPGITHPTVKNAVGAVAKGLERLSQGEDWASADAAGWAADAATWAATWAAADAARAAGWAATWAAADAAASAWVRMADKLEELLGEAS